MRKLEKLSGIFFHRKYTTTVPCVVRTLVKSISGLNKSLFKEEELPLLGNFGTLMLDAVLQGVIDTQIPGVADLPLLL